MSARLGHRIPRRTGPPPRRARWFVLAQLLLGMFLGAMVFDRVLMPLVVRHGTDEIVPNVTKRPQGEAARVIEQSHLRIGRITEVPDAHSRRGEIVAQDPAAGARVRKGRQVDLIVSKGPPVRRVPDLMGKTPRSASITLSQLDLRSGATLTVPSLSIPEGEIIGTRPAQGESPEGEGNVDLLISGGGLRGVYLMPDLVGLDMGEAAARLRTAGISVAAPVGMGKVVRLQDPPPGALIRSGEAARID